MCRHIYDWNIVNCDVKQPIFLTLSFILHDLECFHMVLKIQNVWSEFASQTVTCTSMCRHIYDWNIVNCDVKQTIQLNSTKLLLYKHTVWTFIKIISISRAPYFVKIIWCFRWFCTPPSIKAVFCFICGRRRVAVTQHRMIWHVHVFRDTLRLHYYFNISSNWLNLKMIAEC